MVSLKTKVLDSGRIKKCPENGKIVSRIFFFHGFAVQVVNSCGGGVRGGGIFF